MSKITSLPLLALVALPLCAHAVVLTGVTVTSSSTAFSPDYASSNAVDGSSADYASQGAGPSTFLNFSLGSSPQSFDRVVVVNRNSPDPNDWISNFTVTPAGGSAVAITRAGAQGASNIYSMGGLVTTTSVNLQTNTVAGGGTAGNTGVMEVYFLRNPVNSESISGVSVIDASTAYSGAGNYVASKASDGLIGRSDGAESVEYASSAGTSLFVTFNLGSVKPVTGFDFFDRPAPADRTTGFSLTFSQDAVFGNADDVTQTYANSSSAMSGEFSALSAQYVRYNVTSTAAGFAGMSEMTFYQQVPEASAALLGLLALPLAMKRRRAL
jgi:hypothetical protein